jgi:hypothetical protein
MIQIVHYFLFADSVQPRGSLGHAILGRVGRRGIRAECTRLGVGAERRAVANRLDDRRRGKGRVGGDGGDTIVVHPLPDARSGVSDGDRREPRFLFCVGSLGMGFTNL